MGMSRIGHVAQILSAQRKPNHREATRINGQSSEPMRIAGVLALFVQRVVLLAGAYTEARKVIIASAGMVDAVSFWNRVRVTPGLITDSAINILAQLVAVWWCGLDCATVPFVALLHDIELLCARVSSHDLVPICH